MVTHTMSQVYSTKPFWKSSEPSSACALKSR